MKFDAPSALPPSTVCNSVIHGYTTAGPVSSTCFNVTSTDASAANFLSLLGGDDAFLQCGFSTDYVVDLIQPDAATSPAVLPDGGYAGAIDPNAGSFWTDGWAKFNPHFCCNCPN